MKKLIIILALILSIQIAYADVNLTTDTSTNAAEGAIDGGRTAFLIKSDGVKFTLLKDLGNGLKSTLKALNLKGLVINASKLVPAIIVMAANVKAKAEIKDGKRNTSVKLLAETTAFIADSGIYLPAKQAIN